jgi:hypothetical protein
VVGDPIGRTGLVWTHHTDASNLRLLRSERLDRRVNDRAEDVQRLDSQHEVSRPFNLGAVRVDPHVDGEATAYSDKADESEADLRVATGFGARASTDFFRGYEAHNELLSVERLRHVLTPKIGYLNRWFVSEDPTEYVQHDDVDALDETHLLEFGVRNRLQTKRGAPGGQTTVDFLVIEITDNVWLGDNGANRDRRDFLDADLTWVASRDLTLNSIDNRYTTEDSRLTALMGQVVYSHYRPLVFSYTHQYLNEINDRPRSVSTVQTTYSPRFSRWEYDFRTSYDFEGRRDAATVNDKRDPKQLGMEMRFLRHVHRWIMAFDVGFHQGRDDETTVSFSLMPEGLTRGAGAWRRPAATGVAPPPATLP